MSALPLVAVTGGEGEIGRAVVARLLAGGHGARVVDVARRSRHDDYVRADLSQPWEARRAFAGAGAIVHLAAVGNCDHDDEWCAFRHEAIVRNNVLSTLNVFQAALDHGIRVPVVWASSETVSGPPFDERNRPDYLPVDARHPRRPHSPYGLSKRLCEEVAEYFWNVHGVASVGLRLSVVCAEGPPTYADVADGLWNLWGHVSLERAVDAIVAALGRRPEGAVFEHVVEPEPAAPAGVGELRERFLPDVPPADGAAPATFWR